MTRVVCTGLAAVTGLGIGAAQLGGALREGHRAWSDADPGPGVAASLRFRDVKHLAGVSAIRPGTMTAPTLLAVAASGLAMEDAGLGLPVDADEASGRIYQVGAGTNVPDLARHLRLMHHLRASEEANAGVYRLDDSRLAEGMKGFTGFEFLKLMNNMPGAHGGIQSGSMGPCNTFLGPATSGMQALGRAFRAVRDGRASVAVQ